HPRDVEVARLHASVHTARAAKGYESEIARIVSTRDRNVADAAVHVVVDDPQDPDRGLLHVPTQRTGDVFFDHGPCSARIETKSATEKRVRVEGAEDEIGVGHRRSVPAGA